VNTVAIVDYGMCNLDSVARAVEECGGRARVTDQTAAIASSSRVILPGVGAFAEAMRNIRARGLDQILYEEVVRREVPLLGICLGMQLLAQRGTEIEDTPGLGWIPGEVQRLVPAGADDRVPHVGWNEVYPSRETRLLAGVAPGRDFYFVHSFHFVPASESDIAARTPYGHGFVSAVEHGMIFGVQFHPEKSQRAGFQLLKNFLAV
jgi:imidazole glycerol-phosphate synthase subunit HisH